MIGIASICTTLCKSGTEKQHSIQLSVMYGQEYFVIMLNIIFDFLANLLVVLMCRSTPDKEPAGTEALSGSEALEGFAVGLYSEVFQAVISLINRYF